MISEIPSPSACHLLYLLQLLLLFSALFCGCSYCCRYGLYQTWPFAECRCPETPALLIGRTAADVPAYEPFRPNFLSLGNELAHLVIDEGGPSRHIPPHLVSRCLPPRETNRCNSFYPSPMPVVFDAASRISRKSSCRHPGPVQPHVNIHLLLYRCPPPSDFRLGWMYFAATTSHLQVVSLLPWRFGNSAADVIDSFICVRIQAFLPNACFSSADSQLRVGAPVGGYIDPSSGNARSDQLVGLPTALLLDWKLTCRNTLPPSPWNLNMDAIYGLPQLSARNLTYARVPHVNFRFSAAPAISSVYTVPACRAEDDEAIGRQLGRAQRIAYAPADLLAAPALSPPSRGPSLTQLA